MRHLQEQFLSQSSSCELASANQLLKHSSIGFPSESIVAMMSQSVVSHATATGRSGAAADYYSNLFTADHHG
jgi:hypothetical protein